MTLQHTMDEFAMPGPTGAGSTLSDRMAAVRSESTPVQDTPINSAARLLEMAVETADQLVRDAQTQAESLVTSAEAAAEEIAEASRREADQASVELARSREEQAADLDNERTTALAGLAEERAHLEGQIAALRQTEEELRGRLREHLTQHLALLDGGLESPVSIAG